MIYCLFCCIYVWLDPGTYMIARFMFFYKPGVTEYPDIFFWKYNSPYHIEMGTYILIDLLWANGSVAHAQPTSLQ